MFAWAVVVGPHDVVDEDVTRPGITDQRLPAANAVPLSPRWGVPVWSSTAEDSTDARYPMPTMPLSASAPVRKCRLPPSRSGCRCCSHPLIPVARTPILWYRVPVAKAAITLPWTQGLPGPTSAPSTMWAIMLEQWLDWPEPHHVLAGALTYVVMRVFRHSGGVAARSNCVTLTGLFGNTAASAAGAANPRASKRRLAATQGNRSRRSW